MSLSTIIQKIEAEAEAHGQKLIAKAKAEGEQLIAHERTEAEKEAASILQHAEEELQSFKNKQMATASLQARKEKLENRQKILDQVFAAAAEKVYAYPPEQYRVMVRNMLLTLDEERTGYIRRPATDTSIITDGFLMEINTDPKLRNQRQKYILSDQRAPITKGCIIDFGDYELDYSVKTILQHLWEELKGEVSKRLFEDHDSTREIRKTREI